MIIDGKAIAESIQQKIAEQVADIHGRKPCLAAVVVGEHPASLIYVRRKMEACQSVGIQSKRIDLPHSVTAEELHKEIAHLNNDPLVDGILVQLPLPPHINPLVMVEMIDPGKDVDGLNPVNMGRLLMGQSDGFIPCTPLGVSTVLEKAGIEVAGKNTVVMGRSLIVGKPMAALLLQQNATVTILHSKSRDIPAYCRLADIIIVAIGKAQFLTKEMVKSGAVVIDVGINRVDDPSRKTGYRMLGDVDFDALKNHCSAITPVPGGIGPMTIAMLLSNTLKAYSYHFNGQS